MKTFQPLKKLDYQRFGPFTIMEQIHFVAFQFKLPISMKIHLVFNTFKLEPYHASTIPKRIHEPPPPMKIDCKQKYEMKDVFDSRISNHQLQYLVH
jgi:hypothetical protein